MDKGSEFIKAVKRRYPIYREQQQTVVTYHAEPGDDFDPDIDRMADTPNYFRHYESVSASSNQPKVLVFHAPAEIFAYGDVLTLFGEVIESFIEANFTIYLWNDLHPQKVTSEYSILTLIYSIEFSNRKTILESFASKNLSEQEMVIFDSIDIENLCDTAFSIGPRRFSDAWHSNTYQSWLHYYGDNWDQEGLRKSAKDYRKELTYFNLARYSTLSKKVFRKLVEYFSHEKKLSLILIEGAYNHEYLKLFLSKFNDFEVVKIISTDPDDIDFVRLKEAMSSCEKPFRCMYFEMSLGRLKKGKGHQFANFDVIDFYSAVTENSFGIQGLFISNNITTVDLKVHFERLVLRSPKIAMIKKLHVRYLDENYLPLLAECKQLEVLSIESTPDFNSVLSQSPTQFLQNLTKLNLHQVELSEDTLRLILNSTKKLVSLKLRSYGEVERLGGANQNLAQLKLDFLERVKIVGKKISTQFYVELFEGCYKNLKEVRFERCTIPEFDASQIRQLKFPMLRLLKFTGIEKLKLGLWGILGVAKNIEELYVEPQNIEYLGNKIPADLLEDNSICRFVNSKVSDGSWDQLRRVTIRSVDYEMVPLLKIINNARNLSELEFTIRSKYEIYFQRYGTLVGIVPAPQLSVLNVGVGSLYNDEMGVRDYSCLSIFFRFISASINLSRLELHNINFNEDEVQFLNGLGFHNLKKFFNAKTNWTPSSRHLQQLLCNKIILVEECSRPKDDEVRVDLGRVVVHPSATEFSTVNPFISHFFGVQYDLKISTRELIKVLGQYHKLEKFYFIHSASVDDENVDSSGLYLPYLTLIDARESKISIKTLAILLGAAPNLKIISFKWFTPLKQDSEPVLLRALKGKPLEIINISLSRFSRYFVESLKRDHPNVIIIDHQKIDHYSLKRLDIMSKSRVVVAGSGVGPVAPNKSGEIEVIPSFYDTAERLVREQIQCLSYTYSTSYKPMPLPELSRNLAAHYLRDRGGNKRLKFGVKRYNLLSGEVAVIPSFSTLDRLVGLKVNVECELFCETELRQYAVDSASRQFEVQYLIEVSDFNNDNAPWKKLSCDDYMWVKDIRFVNVCYLERNEAFKKLSALSNLEQIAVVEKYFFAAKNQEMPSKPKDDKDFEFYNAVIEVHGGSCEDRGIATGYILRSLGHNCLLQKNKIHAYVSVYVESDCWPIEVGGLPAKIKEIPLPPLESLIESTEKLEEKPLEKPPSRMLELLRPMPPKDITTFPEYIQWLMLKTENLPATKRQLVLSVEDNVDVRRFINMAYAQLRSEYSICVISDISQLTYKTKRLSDAESTEVDGEVLQFLRSVSKKRLLFLNMQNWSAKWNPLFEENRMLESYPLADDILIVAVQIPAQQLSVDLISRMGFATSFHLKHLLRDSANDCYVTEEIIQQNSSLVPVELNESDNWRSKLVADYDITENGHFRMQPKALIAASEKPAHLLLVNPPDNDMDSDFSNYFESILSARCLFFNGETKKLPDETTLQWTRSKKSLAPYKDNIVLLTYETQHQWIYSLGLDNYRHYFKRYVFSDQGGFVEIPGLLKSFGKATLSVLLTSELTYFQWVELFEEAKANQCYLRVIVPSVITIPHALMPTAHEKSGDSQPLPLLKQNCVMVSQSILETAEKVSRELGDVELIYVSEAMSYSDLFVKIVKTNDRYHCEDSLVCTALKAARTVLLVGQLSQTVQMKIASLFCETPCLMINHEIVPVYGRLIIVTSQTASFPFVLNRSIRHELALLKSDSERKEPAAQDSAQLSENLNRVLDRSSSAIIMRSENSDANHFICKIYPSFFEKIHRQSLTIHYGAKYFDDWMNPDKEGTHVLVITDIDSGNTRKLFVNLIQKQPHVLCQGKLVSITERQKVVFLVTPKQQQYIFNSFLCVLTDNVLHYNYAGDIRAINISPTFYQERLNVIYSKLKQLGFTITPSRYRIVALLDAILLDREKQLKYPGTYNYTPICPVLTGASGIGKTKIVISLLKVLGYVDAASKEATYVDSSKHYYNLNTQDVSQYPDISRVPQHLQRIAIAVRACRMGSLLIGDELNVDPQMMEQLSILLNHFDKKIESKSGFMFIATQNPLSYKNRHKIPHDLEPFVYPIETPELSPSEIVTILKGFGASEYQARQLTKEYFRVTKELANQGNAYSLTVRDLFDYTKQQLQSRAIEYSSSPPGTGWSRFWAARDPEDGIFDEGKGAGLTLKH